MILLDTRGHQRRTELRAGAVMLLLACAAILGPARTMWAQEDRPPAPDAATAATTEPAPRRGGPDLASAIFIPVSFDFGFDADAGYTSGTPGTADRFRYAASTGLIVPYDQGSGRVIFTLKGAYTDYGLTVPETLLPGATERSFDAYEVGFSIAAFGRISDEWRYLLNGGLNWGIEEGANFWSATRASLVAGAIWRESDQFSLTFGAIVVFRLNGVVLPIPIVSLTWEFVEDWTIGLQGRGLALTWNLPETIQFGDREIQPFYTFISMGFEASQFRLAGNNPVPNGVWLQEGVPVAIGFRFEPFRGVKAEIRGGAWVYRQIDIEDEFGGDISEVRQQIHPFFDISLSFTIF